MPKSKLPLTAGMKQKRQAKMSAKKQELVEKIMREHGLDPKAISKANKIVYDIPPLEFTLKPANKRTPVTQILRDLDV